jgi:hypothetical protein
LPDAKEIKDSSNFAEKDWGRKLFEKVKEVKIKRAKIKFISFLKKGEMVTSY